MSKTNNLLTKYFRKSKRNVINEPTAQSSVSIDEEEKDEYESESSSSKRLKLSENNDLSILAYSCGCERSFSSLRRLKTYLRNTMGQERLSGIALFNIEKNVEINMEQILTDFIAQKDSRKTIFLE